MTKLERMQQILETNEECSLREEGLNPTLFWALRDKEEAGNDLINFSEVMWDCDIPEIAETFDESGIKEFTISSTFSGLLDTMVSFDKLGFKVSGLTTVKARYKDWETGEHALINAVKMTRA